MIHFCVKRGRIIFGPVTNRSRERYTGVVAAVVEEAGLTRAENGRYANGETALMFPNQAALLLRRPLLLAFILGCGVSVLASGRFTPRLIVDGGLSFAFVPLCELVAFVVVCRRSRATRPLAQAVDRFFAGNTPWLWWLVGMMAVAAILPARRLGSLLAPLLFTAPIPIALSVRLDWRLFRSDGRTRPQAVADIVLLRAIAWTLATAYFLGIASSRRDFFYLFVEMGQEIAAWAKEML